MIEVLTVNGETAATFALADIERADHAANVVSLVRGGIVDTSLTMESDADAVELVAAIQAQRPIVAEPQSERPSGLRRVAKCGCFALLGLIAVLTILGVIGAIWGDDDEGASPVMPTVPQGAVHSPVPATTPTANAASTATPFQSEDLPGTSPANPIPFGEIGAIKDAEVQVLEVVRGAEALSRLKQANQFNADPPPGYEYVLLNARVTYTGDEPNGQLVDFSWFHATGGARIKHYWAPVVKPDPVLEATLLNGGETAGWAAVLAREAESNLILIFEPLLSAGEGDEVYVALEPGASVAPLEGRLAEENDVGLERENPAPMGAHVVEEDWELWVIEWVRGEDALRRIEAANQFNDDPLPGMEYVLVHIGARNVSPEAKATRIDTYSFTLSGDSERSYTNPNVIAPQLELTFDVYGGGSVDGWVAMQCAVGESNLRVVYEPLFSISADLRYFALS